LGMRHTRAKVRASLCATLALVGAMFVGRLALGTPFIPELIAEQIFALVTPCLFTLAIRLLGFWAKWVALGLAVIGYIGGGVGLGWAYATLLRPHRGEVPASGAVVAGIAFAGERGITQVEVSVDGGKT
jgi:hypothetical protein